MRRKTQLKTQLRTYWLWLSKTQITMTSLNWKTVYSEAAIQISYKNYHFSNFGEITLNILFRKKTKLIVESGTSSWIRIILFFLTVNIQYDVINPTSYLQKNSPIRTVTIRDGKPCCKIKVINIFDIYLLYLISHFYPKNNLPRNDKKF